MTDALKQDQASQYQSLRVALTDRIRRRWSALAHLSPETVDWRVLDAALEAADTPDALIGMLDQVDRRLDAAFAPQSRRAGAAPAASNDQPPDHRAFK